MRRVLYLKDLIMTKEWYQNGLNFSCLQCGKCCWDEGEYTQVYVTSDDIAGMAAYLDIFPSQFYKKYVKQSDGFNVLRSRNGACIMLKGKECKVYLQRPQQCATWPFWPENLRRHVWYGEVKKRCPGVGQGRKYTKEEIERIFLSKDPVSTI